MNRIIVVVGLVVVFGAALFVVQGQSEKSLTVTSTAHAEVIEKSSTQHDKKAEVMAKDSVKSAAKTMLVQEGRHYQLIENPMPEEVPGKIVVTEIFSYSCPHCYNFHPLFERWKQGLSDDVAFRYIHSDWGGKAGKIYANIFYVEQQLGLVDEMHDAVYDRIHKKRLPLLSTKTIAKFFAQYGVDSETFNQLFNSFGSHTALKRSVNKIAHSGVTGTPSLVVNGRYLVVGPAIKKFDDMLKVAGALIEKERQRLVSNAQ